MIRLAHIAQDLRYALKTIWKQPGFASAAVLTLALGIGATAAIFSVIYSVMLRPLPFKDSERFVHLWSQDASGPVRQSVSYPDFLDWRPQSRTFERMSAWVVIDGMPITIGGEAERVEGVGVLGHFFQALGVPPMLGFTFPAETGRREPAEDDAAPQVAIINQTLAGILSGWLGSVALSRWIEGLLFDITATDPLTFGLAILVLALAASLACWIPARRAMRVDPITALRWQ